MSLKDLALKKIEYDAGGGREIFLSFKRKKDDMLASFLRLRLPGDNSSGWGILEDAALIRELHTYGRLAEIGNEGRQSQHRGFGKQLLNNAENIAKKAGYKKIAIISGIGVRAYYRKLGYRLSGTYMVKAL